MKKGINSQIKIKPLENIYNVPNLLTLIRVILTFVLIYMFFYNFSVESILIVFCVAAITDFLDGQVARRFNQVTRFGAKFDILADRFLWISSGLLILFTFPVRGIFDQYHLMQMLLVLTREIVCFPFIFYLVVFKRNKSFLTEAKWSGKTTTLLQGIAIPSIILSAIGYSFFDFSVYLSFITAISGLWSLNDYLKGIGFLK